MSHKFRVCMFFLFFLLFLSNKAYASNTWEYHVTPDDTPSFIDSSTTALIDYDNRQITLPQASMPDIVKFSQPGTYNYAVLTKDGVRQYMFDGEGQKLINSLSVDIDNPLSFAVSPDYPGFSITQLGEDGTDVKNYNHDSSGMVNNPALTIGGLKYIYSISSIDDTSNLAVLTEDSMKMYTSTGSQMVEIQDLEINNIQDPIALSTSNGYNIAILEKTKVEYYKYDGSSFLNIPSLGISFDSSIQKPKAISIKDNIVSILDDTQVKTYQYDEAAGKMEYHAALSINEGLTKPVSIAFKKDTNDLIVIDEKDPATKTFTAKYFMYAENKYVENKQLEVDIQGIVSGNRYYDEGKVVSKSFTTTAAYADMVRIRAYTEIPKGTEIDFYVANSGADTQNANWVEAWKIVNQDAEGVKGIVYKALKNDLGQIEYQEFGDCDLAYPIFDSKPDDGNYAFSDSDINVNDSGGSLNLENNNEQGQLLNLWTKIDIPDIESAKTNGLYKNIRFKAVLKTTDTSVTPKLYVPLGTNNADGLIDANEIALKLDANASPEPPVIGPIDPSHDDEDTYPPVPGWIYTTTPEIKWSFNDSDYEVDPTQIQTAYQVLIMAKKSDGSWKIAYNSAKVNDNILGKLMDTNISTSYNPQIAGPLWASDSYDFAVFVRTWDINNSISQFSTGKEFKVLAFERPRISNIIYPPDIGSGVQAPKSSNVSTYSMIIPGMTQIQLPVAKAGAQITLLVDSIGPIITSAKDIPRFYITINGTDYDMYLSDCTSLKTPGGNNNTWELNFFTNAPITKIPDNTIVKSKLIGTGTIGGTTVLYIPGYAAGVITTKDTIYSDWQVVLQGSDRN